LSPLGPPPADLTRFPRWKLPITRALYRIHRHARARAFGITAGMSAIEEPDRRSTRRWADPSQRAIGVALFGPAGEAAWPASSPEPISSSLLAIARRRYGLIVLPTP
jgi:hypothetical protein